jgi:hypothetical protein
MKFSGKILQIYKMVFFFTKLKWSNIIFPAQDVLERLQKDTISRGKNCSDKKHQAKETKLQTSNNGEDATSKNGTQNQKKHKLSSTHQ